MITAGILFATWAVGAVAVYCCDHDPRATQRERLQYSAMWPVFVVIIAILAAFLGAGKVYGVIRPRKVI